MEDTAKNDVLQIGKFLEDHKARDVSVIDIRSTSSWASYFIIATVSSQTHVKGLQRHLKGYLDDLKQDIIHRHKKIEEGGWTLIDCGEIVIHLMEEEVRKFYDLESLWHAGEVLLHSSKSS
ncbi:MAG: ribosome silencing factor [Spirochaetales bacterium]|jgi:ribosome-associated protein|nr:ribosome silencing factor [Spirochaetales bacterium]